MTAEKVERVEQFHADAVLISNVGVSGRLPAWHFYKRLRRANPELFFLAGAWGARERADGGRFRADENAQAVSSLREALNALDQRAPEIVLRQKATEARPA